MQDYPKTDAGKYNNDEVNLRDFIDVVWRRRVLIISMFLLFVACGAVFSVFAVTPVYSSSTIISLANFKHDLYADVNSAKVVLTSDDFLNKVFKELNLEEQEGLRKDIRVETVKDTKFLRITVRNENPKLARDIAVKAVSVFAGLNGVEYRKHLDIINNQLSLNKGKIEECENEIAGTKKVLSGIDNAGMSSMEKDMWRYRLLDYLRHFEDRKTDLQGRKFNLEKELNSLRNLEVIKTADDPAVPEKSNRKVIITASGMLGVIAGLLLAFVLEFLKKNPLKNILRQV